MKSHDINTSNLRHLMEYYVRKFAATEKLVEEILPEWIAQAGSLRLRVTLRSYYSMVKKQVKKWEVFFAEEKIRFDVNAVNRPVRDMFQETQLRLAQCSNPKEKDAWLLASAQALSLFISNMYEMASGFARSLELERAAHAFEDAVINEKFIYEELSKLAHQEIDLSLAKPVHIPG